MTRRYYKLAAAPAADAIALAAAGRFELFFTRPLPSLLAALVAVCGQELGTPVVNVGMMRAHVRHGFTNYSLAERAWRKLLPAARTMSWPEIRQRFDTRIAETLKLVYGESELREWEKRAMAAYRRSAANRRRDHG